MQNRSIIHSFANALAGIVRMIQTERNAKVHVIVAVGVVTIAAVLNLKPIEWAILILTIGVVLAAEAINTAVEAVVDFVSPEFHDLAKVAKDSTAAAVLIVAIAAVVVGILILGPPLLDRLMA